MSPQQPFPTPHSQNENSSGAPPVDSSESASSASPSNQQRSHERSVPRDSQKKVNISAVHSQRVEGVGSATGKRPKKLKVRHLSELTKRIIIERFEALLDHDEVADSMDIPGLTGKTVANLLDAYRFPTRKPPAREVSVYVGQQRRSA